MEKIKTVNDIIKLYQNYISTILDEGIINNQEKRMIDSSSLFELEKNDMNKAMSDPEEVDFLGLEICIHILSTLLTISKNKGVIQKIYTDCIELYDYDKRNTLFVSLEKLMETYSNKKKKNNVLFIYNFKFDLFILGYKDKYFRELLIDSIFQIDNLDFFEKAILFLMENDKEFDIERGLIIKLIDKAKKLNTKHFKIICMYNYDYSFNILKNEIIEDILSEKSTSSTFRSIISYEYQLSDLMKVGYEEFDTKYRKRFYSDYFELLMDYIVNKRVKIHSKKILKDFIREIEYKSEVYQPASEKELDKVIEILEDYKVLSCEQKAHIYTRHGYYEKASLHYSEMSDIKNRNIFWAITTYYEAKKFNEIIILVNQLTKNRSLFDYEYITLLNWYIFDSYAELNDIKGITSYCELLNDYNLLKSSDIYNLYNIFLNIKKLKSFKKIIKNIHTLKYNILNSLDDYIINKLFEITLFNKNSLIIKEIIISLALNVFSIKKQLSFSDNNVYLYHYSSEKSLPNIISNDNERNKLRMYNSNYMNDPSEGFSFISLFQQDEVKSKVNTLFNKNFEDMNLDNKEVFMTCFTLEKDNLPMWLHYANDAQGINYGFKLSKEISTSKLMQIDDKVYEKNNPTLYTVCYSNNFNDLDDILKSLYTYLEKDLAKYMKYSNENLDLLVKEILDQIRFLFKDNHYSYEKEIRALKTPNPEIIKEQTSSSYSVPRHYVEIDDFLKLEKVVLSPRFKNSSVILPYIKSTKLIKKVEKSNIKYRK